MRCPVPPARFSLTTALRPRWLVAFLIFIAPAVADEPALPLAPADAQALFQLAPGLRIELFAAEPLVVDPVEIAFDARGRCWVVEMSDYPNGPPEGQPPLSRIRILIDDNADGRPDRAHTFADNLLFANGLQPWKDGAIVTAAGVIMHLRDTDGDDTADHRETLFEGFAEGNPQLRVSHPTLGLDNHVYVANGLRGGKVHRPGTPTTEALDLGGLDFRFDPLTLAGEGVSGMGQYGLAFDAHGNRFVCDNRHHLRQIVFPESAARRNPFLAIPQVVQDVSVLDREEGPLSSGGKIYPISRNWTTSNLHAGRFTAACGVHIHQGAELPARYQGAAFTCEPTGNLVHCESLSPNGPTFQARPEREGVEFLATNDVWFRPVNLADGPDGALYVVDMYRAVIEHPEWMPPELRQRPDLRDGDDRGRIWRIVPAGTTTGATPASLANLSTAALTDRLGHDDGWHRSTAQRLLLEQQDPAAIPLLSILIADSPRPLARIQAASLLQTAAKLDESTLIALLADPDPRVREHAALLSEQTAAVARPVREAVSALAGDPDPRVRYQAALTLGTCDDDAILAPLSQIALASPDDNWTRLAVQSAVPTRAAALIEEIERFSPPDRPAADRAPLLRELARIVGARRDAAELKRLITRLDPARADVPPPVPVRMVLLAGLTVGLSRGGANLGETLADLSQSSPGEPTLAGRLLAPLIPVATDPAANASVRLDAIRLLAALPWSRSGPVLIPLIQDSQDPALLQAAIQAAAAHPDPAVDTLLIDAWPASTPAVRRALADALLATPQRRDVFLAAMEASTIPPTDLDPGQSRRLREEGPEPLRERAATLLATAKPAARSEAVAAYQAALTKPGDIERGRLIFRAQCATCHLVAGEGFTVGPDISDNRDRDRANLLGNILDPNQAIDGNYVAYIVALTDGTTLDGVLVSETASSLTLRRSGGTDEVILRKDIEELRSTGVSLMPEGLEQQINVDQMADLLTFLKDWRYASGEVPPLPSSH